MSENTQIVDDWGNTEGDTVRGIGKILIGLSVILAIMGIIFFSKSDDEWRGVLAAYWFAVGVSGVLFGYVVIKIGSILKHLEKLNSK